MKRKDLPKCPYCGSRAFLRHDVYNGVDYGYTCGCPKFYDFVRRTDRGDDGIHQFVRDGKKIDDVMSISFVTRYMAIRVWCRKCEEIERRKAEDGKRKVSEGKPGMENPK